MTVIFFKTIFLLSVGVVCLYFSFRNEGSAGSGISWFLLESSQRTCGGLLVPDKGACLDLLFSESRANH